MNINKASVRKIEDSRGRPTVEVEFCAGSVCATASVPSGKSTGSREALEKRDKDGQGVSDVVTILEKEVFPKITTYEFSSQRSFDEFLIKLDGTPNKSRIGANGILAASIAFAKLSARALGKPLWQFISESEHFVSGYPRLYMNMMNGGAHADFRLPFQEYIVVVGGTPSVAYEHAQQIFMSLGELINAEVGEVPMGDEGGYSPQFSTIERPFELLRDLTHGNQDCFLAIDAAATELVQGDAYELIGKQYSHGEITELYHGLVERFNLRSIEDPFAEDDPGCFAALLDQTKDKDVLVVGDDLTVTNPMILKEMITEKAANALIIKPNQVGTLSEVYDAVRLAHGAGWKTIVSHRSGETEDAFIADLAVGVGAYGIKAGAPSQRVRAVKYERLIAIEKERGVKPVS